jgi:hypothetical protein
VIAILHRPDVQHRPRYVPHNESKVPQSRRKWPKSLPGFPALDTRLLMCRISGLGVSDMLQMNGGKVPRKEIR